MNRKKPVILIVDDDAWMAEHNAAVLNAAGYSAHIEKHALSAIDRIDELKPDVLILDILLPGATGFSLLHELQSYRDTAAIPVVICSGVADTMDLENLKPYGVQRILDKSTMTPDDLVASMKAVLL